MAVTQGDVAARAGVAPRTVSNVINHFPHVSDAVRTRVEAAIEELGYRPNRAAQDLRRGRSDTIGLILPEIDLGYFGEIGRLIIEQAKARGFVVLIAQTLGDLDREVQTIDRFIGQQPAGLLISPIGISRDSIAEHIKGTPIVLLGEQTTDDSVHVAIDNVSAARLCADHLIEQGCRSIAFIGRAPSAGLEMAEMRLRGYREALDNAGLPVDERLVRVVSGYHRTDGYTATRELLQTGVPFDGLLCATDLHAFGALRALADSDIDVPGDVAVVGFDNLDDCAYSTPRLTSLAPDKARLASAALEILLAQINKHDFPDYRDVAQAFRLEVRESSVRRPAP